MEILKGPAVNLRHTIEVEGGSYDTSSSTRHIAIFDVNGIAVRLSASEPVILNTGDVIVVSGERRHGVFQAYAYFNQSRQLYGQDAYMLQLILGPLFVALGIVMPFNMLGGTSIEGIARGAGVTMIVALPLFFGGIFVLFGLYMIYRGWRVKRAMALL